MRILEAALSSNRTHAVPDFFLSEVLDKNEPHARSLRMSAANKSEIKNILDRCTFKLVVRKDFPKDGNVLPGRFVLAIKSSEDRKEKYTHVM